MVSLGTATWGTGTSLAQLGMELSWKPSLMDWGPFLQGAEQAWCATRFHMGALAAVTLVI